MSQISRVLPAQRVESLPQHLSAGGGDGRRSALHRTPAGIVHTIERSGLRGRGGAGFPTGRKWRSVIANRSLTAPTTVVVNAAEGEPGTFKDRAILRANPYLVVEGALIAAIAVGATDIVIALKVTFTHEHEHLTRAVDEITEAGWLEGRTLRVVEGPSEYLFGEETALLEVLEGRPPFPRIAPPYRRGLQPHHPPTGHSAAGLHLAVPGGDDVAPVLVDNVETLANVALILHHGADWFRSIGTAESPGSIVCTVSGDAAQHGVGEFAMGTPLREVIDQLGGGPRPDHHIVAVLPGVSNPMIPAAHLDTPLTYEDLAAIGSGLGSAGFIVVDDGTDLRQVAADVARFLAVESCGQCEPCKRDGLEIHHLLAEPRALDVEALRQRISTVARGARCALAGQTERVVGSLVEAAAAAAGPFEPGPSTILPIADLIGRTAVLDTTHRDKQPDWTSDRTDSGKWPAQRLADQPVELTGSHVPEHDEPGPVAPAGTTDWSAEIVASHRAIADAVAALRAAGPADRPAASARLHQLLVTHVDLAQRYLYPMVIRTDPADGAEIAWYPAVHEREALRLLDRLDALQGTVDARAVDELTTDVHRFLLEIEQRLLPLLTERLDDDEQARLGAAISADAQRPSP